MQSTRPVLLRTARARALVQLCLQTGPLRLALVLRNVVERWLLRGALLLLLLRQWQGEALVNGLPWLCMQDGTVLL